DQVTQPTEIGGLPVVGQLHIRGLDVDRHPEGSAAYLHTGSHRATLKMQCPGIPVLAYPSGGPDRDACSVDIYVKKFIVIINRIGPDLDDDGDSHPVRFPFAGIPVIGPRGQTVVSSVSQPLGANRFGALLRRG